MARKSKRLHAPGSRADRHDGKAPGKYYKAGIYARLSSDLDLKKNESIDVQIGIARKFVEEWNGRHTDRIEVVDCYRDLGKTGTNFERDEFKRLMQDVRLGDINCVIVKDLSRFGRNYLEAGNYIEKIFPFLGVRFIAVADGFDTGAEGNGGGQVSNAMAVEIKNLVNDMYAKDFSYKAKLSLAQRRQAGAYVGGPPPYGYKAVWEGKTRRLVPDEDAAEVVRFIYRKFAELGSYKAVTDEVNARRINPPAVYRKCGEAYCPSDVEYKGWDKSGVERLLKSETYSGKLVQGKTSITARNERNRVHKSEGDWVVCEDAHEPLISGELFRDVAEVRRRLSEQSQGHGNPTGGIPIGENIFDKVLYCGACGRKMTRYSYVKMYADGHRERVEGYFCGNHNSSKAGAGVCPESNRISQMVLTDILYALFRSEFLACLKKQGHYVEEGREIIRQRKAEMERELQTVRQEKERLEAEESRIYRQYRLGEMPQKDYVEYKMRKEDCARELAEREKRFQDEMAGVEKRGEAYLKAVRCLASLKKGNPLTKELVETLMEKIFVYPGKRVEVVFAYEDVRKGGGW